jgi:hypothetical protein
MADPEFLASLTDAIKFLSIVQPYISQLAVKRLVKQIAKEYTDGDIELLVRVAAEVRDAEHGEET